MYICNCVYRGYSNNYDGTQAKAPPQSQDTAIAKSVSTKYVSHERNTLTITEKVLNVHCLSNYRQLLRVSQTRVKDPLC